MSKRDGKATLLGAEKKEDTYELSIPAFLQGDTEAVASVCPVKIIKVGVRRIVLESSIVNREWYDHRS